MSQKQIAKGGLGYCGFTPSGGSEVFIPVYEWNIQTPRNRVTGDPVGSTWSTSYADGLLTSRLTARIISRKTALECFSDAFLEYFVNRVVTGGLDDTVPFAISASDGAAVNTLANAKPESFTLTIAKGSPVGLSVVFVAPAETTITSGLASDLTDAYAYTVDNTSLLKFDSASFGYNATPGTFSGLTDSTTFYSAKITYSNNHIASANAQSVNAGAMSCIAEFTIATQNSPDLVFGAGAAIQITLGLGGSNVIRFNLAKVVSQTDLDASANVGANYRTITCDVLGIGGESPLRPLTLAYS